MNSWMPPAWHLDRARRSLGQIGDSMDPMEVIRGIQKAAAALECMADERVWHYVADGKREWRVKWPKFDRVRERMRKLEAENLALRAMLRHYLGKDPEVKP